MSNAVNFILESGISLSLFALVYVLFLRKETFFKLNRFFLLGSVLFSVVLPFLRFQVFNANPVMLTEITVTPYRNLIEAVTVYGKDLSGSIEQAILSADAIIFIYLTGVVFLFLRFLLRIARISWLISRNPVQKMNGFSLVTLAHETSPFSFLNYVFLSESLQKEADHQKMIAHELEHIKQGHTFDVLILEILSLFQWFNPFMWMLRRAIRENHEFLADQAVLSSGINRGYYKKLLLNQYIGEKFQIANNFNYSLIKNRIKMMSKLQSPKFANWKMVFGILAAAALIVVFACEQKESFEMPGNPEDQTLKMTVQNEKLKIEGAVENLQKVKQLFSDNTDFEADYDSMQNILLLKKENIAEESVQPENDKVFFIVEDMPEFPGGETALRNEITTLIQYPGIAVENDIQGKVFVSFIVDKSGQITNAKIARGVHPALNKEALRVINSLPNWEPGKQRGQAVNVSYTVPINFTLQ
jgi:TonB family protein